MARKVFISFLGTGNYVQTAYSFPNGNLSNPVRFIQEALILHTCSEWTENDKIYIFCTDGANKSNWVDNGQARIFEEIERIGLEHRLKEAFPKYDIVEKVFIPEGFSETEIWDIFNIVYSKLKEGDEIFFDVTHAFRSIPLFSTVLFNYSRFMKYTNVVSIMYGAFEKLGPAFEVRKMNVEERIAPIIDLTNVARLQQFTDMANSLTTFGRLNTISSTLDRYANENDAIEQMRNGIEQFDNFLTANKMTDIKQGKWFIKINNSIKKVQKSDIPTPIKNSIIKLQEHLKGFQPKDCNENVEAAIEWAKKYKMLPTAYTLGQEYIISLLEEKLNEYNPFSNTKLSKRDKKVKFRTFISSVCSISDDDILNDKFRSDSDECISMAYAIWTLDYIKQVRKYFPLLGINRNTVNHAKNSDKTYQDLVDDFEELFYNCLTPIKNAD